MGSFFFFNDTATTEIYTLSLHDALPICQRLETTQMSISWCRAQLLSTERKQTTDCRSEEHTSELQSRQYLVCRLLLEKKKYCSDSCSSSVSLATFASSPFSASTPAVTSP